MDEIYDLWKLAEDRLLQVEESPPTFKQRIKLMSRKFKAWCRKHDLSDMFVTATMLGGINESTHTLQQVAAELESLAVTKAEAETELEGRQATEEVAQFGGSGCRPIFRYEEESLPRFRGSSRGDIPAYAAELPADDATYTVEQIGELPGPHCADGEVFDYVEAASGIANSAGLMLAECTCSAVFAYLCAQSCSMKLAKDGTTSQVLQCNVERFVSAGLSSKTTGVLITLMQASVRRRSTTLRSEQEMQPQLRRWREFYRARWPQIHCKRRPCANNPSSHMRTPLL